MTNTWRLLITPPARGAWNMAADEAILEAIARGESPAVLRLYAWQPACLSLGYAQRFSDVDTIRLRERGWEVVRRVTGGRAILHTDELTYSVIAPNDEPRVAGTILESYSRLAKALLLAVQSLELAVEMKQDAGQVDHSANVNPVCFEVPSSYEITVDEKKIIGSAQARRKEGVLQHGSLPLTGDLSRICQALVFTDEPARSDARQRLLARAATVESVLGKAVSWESAAQAFIHAFGHTLDLRLEQSSLSQKEISRTEELMREKYDSNTWTQRV